MSFKVLQIRIFKKALFAFFFICIKGRFKHSVAFPHVFASNNIAQYTVDSARQLKAAVIGDYVVINTVTLHIMGGKFANSYTTVCVLSAYRWKSSNDENDNCNCKSTSMDTMYRVCYCLDNIYTKPQVKYKSRVTPKIHKGIFASFTFTLKYQ